MSRRSPLFEAVEYFGFRCIATCAGTLSHRGATAVGKAVAMLGYHLGVRRAVTMDNLRHAFPEATEHERSAIARGAFRNYGISLAEMMWSSHASVDEVRALVSPVHYEVFAAAFGRGKGVVLLSGHYGSWEIIASAVPHHLPAPLTIIYQTQRNRRVDAFLLARRTRFGCLLVSMRDAPREVLRTLPRGGIVAMLGDQSGASESPYVEYFGRPAATHRGPALFALKTGAPLVMYFLERQPDGRYVMEFEEVPTEDLNGTLDDKVLELTRRHVATLERHVRKHPDHWLWMHKRWKHTEVYLQRTGQR